MTDFTPDQTVYLPDGREAVYVTKNGQDHLVRVVHEVPDSHDEPGYSYPSDKITVARTVYAAPPVDVWDKQVLAKRQQVSELDLELNAKRAELVGAERNKTQMEKAAAKYPCIQDALDFIEGRITHVVKWSGYGAATVHAMPEAFQQIDTWGGRKTHEGMRLLSLFGTDERGRSVGWGLHTYRDGSGGSTTQIWPARSEAEARAKVQELMDAAIAAFRSGDEKWYLGHISIDATLEANPWMDTPEDWAAHIAEAETKARQQKIDKLRAELTALEAGVQPSQKKRGGV
jgi:hypothetical protein